MALTVFKTILRAIDENSNPNKEEQRHAEKIKNIKQLIASGF